MNKKVCCLAARVDQIQGKGSIHMYQMIPGPIRDVGVACGVGTGPQEAMRQTAYWFP